MIFNTLSIVLLCLDALLVVYLAFGEKIANKLFIGKKIKFAKLAYIVPIVIVLYATLVLQMVYNATVNGIQLTVFDFINVVDATKKLFGASVSPGLLVAESLPFYFALLFGALLAFGSTLFVTVKIIFYFIYNNREAKHILRNGCNIYLGYDPSVKYDANNSILWLDDAPSEELRKSLKAKELHFVAQGFTQQNLQRQFEKFSDKSFTFILNFKTANYFSCVSEFEKFLKSGMAQNKEYQGFTMWLLLDYDNYFTIRDHILTDEVRAKHIVCINMYETMALQFVEEHPITELLDGNAINYQSATVKEDCEINVLYIGFGKVGYSLFFNNVVNDQLVCARKTNKGYELAPKLVNYYAYDKNKEFSDGSNYNHSYGKLQNILQFQRKSAYFPLPDKPCNFVYNGEMDINSQNFWNDITKVLCANPNSYNRIFVSVGNDEDNIDQATKILLFMRQCNKQNFHIYIRTKERTEIFDNLFGEDQKYVSYFGRDLSVQEIKEVVEHQQQEAQIYHKAYIKNGGNSNVQKAWKSVYNARSDRCAAINIQLKFNMIGCKMQRAKDKCSKTQNEVLEKVLAYDVNKVSYEQKKFLPVKYISDIQPAKALAYQEKLRWNAFMMSNRFVPMEIAEVVSTGNTKDFVTMKHACLTSVQGLHELHEKLAKMQNKTLEDVDLYKYDYNFVENMQNILQDVGKEIVSKD